MSRSVDEWKAKHDDQDIPPRIKLRLFEAANGRCQQCTRKIGPGAPFDYDHIKPLILGGEHRETNLQVLCKPCHAVKTKADTGAKSKVADTAKKHLGLAKPKNPMPGSRQSKWRRRMDGTVERRT